MRLASPESDVLKSCMALLKFRGIPHWRNNTGCTKTEARFIRYGKVGSSDIIGILPETGRFLAIEVKRPKSPGKRAGELTGAQRDFLEMIRAANGVAICVSDLADLAEVISTLEISPMAMFEIDGTVITTPATEEQR